MDKHFKAGLCLCLLWVVILVMITPFSYAAGVVSVVRAVSDTGKSNDEFEITLKINDSMPSFLGLKEIMPNGYTFISTSLPQDQYKVSGNTITFVAINTSDIRYIIKGPPSGKGSLKGTWVDMLSDNKGDIIYAGTISDQNGSVSSSGASKSNIVTPGFEIMMGVFAMACIYLLYGGRK